MATKFLLLAKRWCIVKKVNTMETHWANKSRRAWSMWLNRPVNLSKTMHETIRKDIFLSLIGKWVRAAVCCPSPPNNHIQQWMGMCINSHLQKFVLNSCICCYQCSLGHLNRTRASLMWLVTPVLLLLWPGNMSAWPHRCFQSLCLNGPD